GHACGHHRRHVEGHGLLHAPVPRRPADRARRAARGRPDRRREHLAAVLERHAALPEAHDVLRDRHGHDPELQGLRPHPRHDRRRTGAGDPRAEPVHLPEGLRAVRVRVRLVRRRRPVPHLHPRDRGAVPVQQAEGGVMTARPSALQRSGRVLLYVVMVAAAAGIMLPFAWMVISSLKQNNQVFTAPVEWVPDPVVWRNYLDIWVRADMVTWVRNTLVLSVAVTALQVLTGSFAAYGFAKMRFPGRDALFLLYIGTIAVPWQSYMIPQFQMISSWGLNNTLWAIMLLQAFGAFGVFLMKQYYESIPDSLSEAARIDGLSEYGIWWRIIMPLSVPALASLTIITFVSTWNDYLGPLIYLRDRSLWTIQLGLQSFIGEYNAEHALIMTG